jgi:hypothetical protein
VNARGVARLGLLAVGLALSAAAAGGTQEFFPSTNTLVSAAYSIEGAAFTSDDSGGASPERIVGNSGTPAQSMAGGCERERRPNCNRPGRRSSRR